MGSDLTSRDGATWGALIQKKQRRHFAGRSVELATIEEFLAGDRLMLHIHGVAGIGKSATLAEVHRRLVEDDVATRWFDADTMGAATEAVAEALRPASSVDGGRTVLLVDEFHALEGLFGWLRDEFLPSLDQHIKLVTASRRPLPANWTSAPGWHRLMQSLELESLDTQTAQAIIARLGVPEHRRADAVAFAAGHPLSLMVAGDTLSASPDAPLGSVDDLRRLRPLLEEMREHASTRAQRDTMSLSALVRFLDEPLLAHALGVPDASDELRWLGQRPFFSRHERGFTPHPVVRELITRDLIEHAGGRVERLLERAADYFIAEALSSKNPTPRISFEDAFYLTRLGKRIDDWVVREHTALAITEPDEADAARVLEVVREHEGPRSAECFEHWWVHQPEGLKIFRDRAGEAAGYAFFVDVDPGDARHRERDPLFDATCDYLDEAPLRGGEVARLCRFWGTFANHQRPDPLFSEIMVYVGMKMTIGPAGLGVQSFLDSAAWMNRPENILHLIAEATIDGASFGAIGADWRACSRNAFLHNMIQSVRGQVPPNERIEISFQILDFDTFREAVVDALKNFHRGDRLADNSLLTTRIVAQRYDEDATTPHRVDVLRELLRDVCRDLGHGGDDALHVDILTQTYLSDTPRKHRAVADDFNMAYSTFRKHLATATERVMTRLWERETSGS